MGIEALAGKWLTIDEHNTKGLLEKMNVAWVKRQAAAAFGYGKGKARNIITVEGDKITIQIVGLMNTTNVFSLTNSEPQDGQGPDGSDAKCIVSVEGDTFVQIMKPKGGGPDIECRRFVRDGQMILEFKCEDVFSTRTFAPE